VLFPRERNIKIYGSLGLYDKDIALVMCFYYSNPYAVHDIPSDIQPAGIDKVRAVGRAFSSGTLMSATGNPIYDRTPNLPEHALMYSTCAITEVRCCIISFILA
jgi:hypothetical protein